MGIEWRKFFESVIFKCQHSSLRSVIDGKNCTLIQKGDLSCWVPLEGMTEQEILDLLPKSVTK